MFALNKADLLEKADVLDINALDLVTEDLTKTLTNDGFTDPDLFVVAADPASGPPTGIDELRDALDERLASKHAAAAKIIEDIGAAAKLLGREAGLSSGAGTGHAEQIARSANNTAWVTRTLDELDLGGPTTHRILADPTDRIAVAAALTERAELAAVIAAIAVACAELSAQLEAGTT
ncbi:MAG: hypothetical protein IIC70_05545 [Acidobacteria bacterium]|nr:hypothetical protein [Acidobacteriota bacterium]